METVVERIQVCEIITDADLPAKIYGFLHEFMPVIYHILSHFMPVHDDICEISCFSTEPKRYFIKQVDINCAIYGKRLEAKAVQKERGKHNHVESGKPTSSQ